MSRKFFSNFPLHTVSDMDDADPHLAVSCCLRVAGDVVSGTTPDSSPKPDMDVPSPPRTINHFRNADWILTVIKWLKRDQKRLKIEFSSSEFSKITRRDPRSLAWGLILGCWMSWLAEAEEILSQCLKAADDRNVSDIICHLIPLSDLEKITDKTRCIRCSVFSSGPEQWVSSWEDILAENHYFCLLLKLI